MKKNRSSKEAQKIKKPRFDAALTQNEVYDIESAYNKTWGVKRRTMFLALTLSSQELLEKFDEAKEDREAMLAMMEFVAEYKKHLENYLELSTTAFARLAATGVYHLQHKAGTKAGI